MRLKANRMDDSEQLLRALPLQGIPKPVKQEQCPLWVYIIILTCLSILGWTNLLEHRIK